MNVGITYEIRDNSNPDLVYYGSSELSLDERMKKHIDHFNAWKKTGIGYCSSFKILELNNYKYDIIDIVYFDTKYELREYERPLIEGQVCVNERIPNRSRAEYYQNNKDKLLKQVADYKLKNKEKLKEKFVCPCGGRYTHPHKAKHIKTNKHQKWALSQTSKTNKSIHTFSV